MNYLLSRKNLVAAISMLALFTCSIASAEKHKSHSSDSCCKSVKKQLKRLAKKHAPKECCECEPICQEKINEAGGTLILRKSGNYALKHDVTGTIVVASDSVCIDLCCHTLSAGGRANAIVANGHEGLDVFNGRIINATDAAILVQNYNATELYDLTMSSNLLDAIREQNSTDVDVHDVNFINDNSGERALLLDTCDNISIKNCNMSGFLSTIGAILELDACHNASVQDVNISNCTKTSAAGTYFFTAPTAFVFVGGGGIPTVDTITGCTGVHFERVRVNNNMFNNTVPVSDPNSIGFNFRTAEAILFSQSTSCSINQCETSNNQDTAGNLATSDTEDYMLCLLHCQNCEIFEHQANNNSSSKPIFYFYMIAMLDSSNIVCDSCQANTNEIAELAVIPGSTSVMFAIDADTYFRDAPVENFIIRNCQANFNRINNAPANPNESVFNAIRTGGSDTIIENCQANDNFVGSLSGDLFRTYCLGVLVGDVLSNVVIANCQANSNTGGEIGSGYTIVGNDVHNVKIVDCSGNSNSSFGVFLINDNKVTPSNNIEIINSTFAQNGSANPVALETYFGPVTAAGIASFNRGAFGVAGMTNVLIKGCAILDTFSTEDTTGFPVGIYFTLNQNVVIEDTEVFNTTTASALGGHGILFDTLTDSKIIRTQVHGNQNSGIEIVGDNSTLAIIECIAMDNHIGVHFAASSTAACSLVQDSRALRNTTAGFSYEPALLTVTFIGNEAQCNGPCVDFNYEGLNTTINLQQISWTNGAFTPVNPVGPGQAAIGARFTNMRGPGPVCTP